MEKLIYTYALAKSLFDQGEDYIDAFWPFVIKTLPADRFMDSGSIQGRLREKFNLEVPLYILGTVVTRAKKKGYVERQEKQYKLTKKGLEYLDKLETDKGVERRINALFKDIEQFFTQKECFYRSNQIPNLLLSFLHKNIRPIIEFINPSASQSEFVVSKFGGNEGTLIEYIKYAEQQNPEHYGTLQDMILGSIISVVLYAEEPSKITEIITRKFKHCQVFFDTNFVFFILDLYNPEFNEPAKELFNLLEKYGFDLKVFDFTVNEICRVIGGYPREAYRYPTTVCVDTLYGSLKRKGWTKTDAREFIVNIEGILSEKRIQIEWETKEINLKAYTPTNEELRNTIEKYKPLQSIVAQNHDLAAIEKIKEFRERPVRNIEDSKGFFLTSDGRLSRFNFIEMGHKENGTVCEVILDRLLANILWLKDPSTKPPIGAIIAAYSRDLFIKRRIWDRFYEVVQQLRQQGEVKDDNISMLFYHGYIEDVLKELDENEVDKITPEFALEAIEEAFKLPEEESKKKIEEKEKEFLQLLREKVSEKEQEKEKEWSERLQIMKNGLRKSTEIKAERDSTIYASALTLLVVVVMYGLYLVCKKVEAFEFLTIALPLIFGSGGILGIWIKIRRYLKSKLSRRIYNQKLKEIRLDEIEERPSHSV